jgi:hypothetical protein
LLRRVASLGGALLRPRKTHHTRGPKGVSRRTARAARHRQQEAPNQRGALWKGSGW